MFAINDLIHIQSPAETQLKRLPLSALTQVEDYLRLQELISLVFLLFTDNNAAEKLLYRTLKDRKSTTGFLKIWAKQWGDFWRPLLIEGLIIIQAFTMIDNLQLNLQGMIDMFPSMYDTQARNVDPVKKSLYVTCHAFNTNTKKKLISSICQKCPDIVKNDVDLEYFELFIYKLIRKEFITLGATVTKCDGLQTGPVVNESSSLNKLIEELQQLELPKLGQHLMRFQENNINGFNSKRLFTKPINVGNPDITFRPPSTIEDITPSAESYPILDATNMGIILIINQKSFPDDILSYRSGSDKDKDNLIKTWKNFGFKEIVLEDLTAENMITKIKETIHRDVKHEHSAFILCILSHGEQGVVYASDCVAIPIDYIERLLFCSAAPVLMGKPKIIIVQACQGNESLKLVNKNQCKLQEIQGGRFQVHDGPENLIEFENDLDVAFPDRSDIIVCMAVASGAVAYRDPEMGSYYIMTLCEKLNKVTRQDNFLNVLTAVNRALMEHNPLEDRAQMPEFRSSLMKTLQIRKI